MVKKPLKDSKVKLMRGKIADREDEWQEIVCESPEIGADW